MLKTMQEKIYETINAAETFGVEIKAETEYDKARQFHIKLFIGNSSLLEVFENDYEAEDDERFYSAESDKVYWLYRNDSMVLAGNDMFDCSFLAGFAKLLETCIDCEKDS